MANDRIWLRCKGCSQAVLLAKFYPAQGTGSYVPNFVPERLSRFMEQHIPTCHPRAFTMSLEGDPGFDLVTDYGEFTIAPRGPIQAVNAEPDDAA